MVAGKAGVRRVSGEEMNAAGSATNGRARSTSSEMTLAIASPNPALSTAATLARRQAKYLTP